MISFEIVRYFAINLFEHIVQWRNIIYFVISFVHGVFTLEIGYKWFNHYKQLQPENILVDPVSLKVYIIDFGFAKFSGEREHKRKEFGLTRPATEVS